MKVRQLRHFQASGKTRAGTIDKRSELIESDWFVARNWVIRALCINCQPPLLLFPHFSRGLRRRIGIKSRDICYLYPTTSKSASLTNGVYTARKSAWTLRNVIGLDLKIFFLSQSNFYEYKRHISSRNLLFIIFKLNWNRKKVAGNETRTLDLRITWSFYEIEEWRRKMINYHQFLWHDKFRCRAKNE